MRLNTMTLNLNGVKACILGKNERAEAHYNLITYLFVCVKAQSPSQQYFSLVRAPPRVRDIEKMIGYTKRTQLNLLK